MENTSQKYELLESKDDDDYRDGLIDHDEGLISHAQRARKSSKIPWQVALHLTAILFYGVAAIFLAYSFNLHGDRGQSLIYSPANIAVEYKAVAYDPKLRGDPEYFGVPSEELDRNWNRLLTPSTIHLTPSERQHYDPQTPIVQLPDGTYLVQIMVYHELHCLKRLYQYINSDYYFPNLTRTEQENNKRHNEHCLGMLRQGVMCHGDVSVVKMVWGEHGRVPLGDFSNPHQCVNFDKLHNWAMDRSVLNALEPGVLVHPKFGPSFPDGQGLKIGFGHGDVDKDGNIIPLGSSDDKKIP